MKFTINKTELQTAIGVVIKGVSKNSTLPVLSGIMVDVGDEEVTFQSTDLEYSVQCRVPALVEEPGKSVLPGKLINDIVKSLPDAAVVVKSEESEARILCDTSSFSVRTLNADDFPGFPQIEPEQTISVPFLEFAAMVRRVARAVSRDESRAILTGVLTMVENDTFRMVTTDSYRLALTESVLPNHTGEDFEAVIPSGFLTEVANLPRSAETVQIALAQNQIMATCGDVMLISRRIEGNYPNYKQLIPETHNCRAEMDVHAFQASVKRAALMCTKSVPMRFDLNIASQTTQITVNSPDQGTAQETIVGKIEGEDAQVAFNSDYVLDGLSVIGSETVALEVQSEMKPGILRAVGGENYLYLIMPVRI